jgi:hypothetical protein
MVGPSGQAHVVAVLWTSYLHSSRTESISKTVRHRKLNRSGTIPFDMLAPVQVPVVEVRDTGLRLCDNSDFQGSE